MENIAKIRSLKGGKGARAVNRKPQIPAPGIRFLSYPKKRTNGNEFLGHNDQVHFKAGH